MDDLSGLDWNTSASSTKPAGAQYSSVLPTASPGLSRGSTPVPLSAQASGSGSSKPAGKASSYATESFSSLLSSKPKPNGPLSLQERQKQILEEKARQAAQQHKHYNTDTQFWEGLGSGTGTPNNGLAPPSQPPSRAKSNSDAAEQDDDDILAAFNSSAPVDASSHFPPPSGNGYNILEARPAPNTAAPGAGNSVDDDDDPFGLNHFPQNQTTRILTHRAQENDDDDILGALGQPVVEQKEPLWETGKTSNDSSDESDVHLGSRDHPADGAVAELVDMGFSVDKSREALAHTSTGTDVQAAVGWLLNQAHEESRSKPRPGQSQSRSGNGSTPRKDLGGQTNGSRDSVPAWAREEEGRRRQDSRSPSTRENDVSQYASEIGSSFLKSANSLWKSGQKKIQKTVSEFQQEQQGDGSQPRWMREVQGQDDQGTIHQRGNWSSQTKAQPSPSKESRITNEALMLEGDRSSPRLPPSRPTRPDPSFTERSESQARQQSPLSGYKSNDDDVLKPPRPPQPKRPVERISKQTVGEQSAQAYVSPARRRKPPTQPNAPKQSVDLFSDSKPGATRPHTDSRKIQKPAPPIPSNPLQIRPRAAPRQFTQISASQLSISNISRKKGTESFRRGDYAEALSHYSNALSPLPENHPVAIVVRCNRAVTNIKVGESKAAVADADAALAIIGVSRGEGETIPLGGDEGDKDMKDFYGKALMRKAEAFENMEKWLEASKAWREAVEAGVGGTVSIQGRNRCEKASSTGKSSQEQAASALPKKEPPRKQPMPKISTFNDLNGEMNPGAEAEAVKRLRAANAAASAASDEAFALTDVVDARLNTWRAGKVDNLRGLLASLDKVLWVDAGWTKVGMGDLVLPNKVKIVYMKAIAKVHPDKISQNATTEQKMVSSSVFATLNEAWDSFKRDNNL